jgi:uncharacterized protein YceH (UPF0502 family)
MKQVISAKVIEALIKKLYSVEEIFPLCHNSIRAKNEKLSVAFADKLTPAQVHAGYQTLCDGISGIAP